MSRGQARINAEREMRREYINACNYKLQMHASGIEHILLDRVAAYSGWDRTAVPPYIMGADLDKTQVTALRRVVGFKTLAVRTILDSASGADAVCAPLVDIVAGHLTLYELMRVLRGLNRRSRVLVDCFLGPYTTRLLQFMRATRSHATLFDWRPRQHMVTYQPRNMCTLTHVVSDTKTRSVAVMTHTNEHGLVETLTIPAYLVFVLHTVGRWAAQESRYHRDGDLGLRNFKEARRVETFLARCYTHLSNAIAAHGRVGRLARDCTRLRPECLAQIALAETDPRLVGLRLDVMLTICQSECAPFTVLV